MKKSFMTRVLATGLSLAMAFSLTAATNVSVASAAAKPAMNNSKMTVKVGQSKNYKATTATQKAYKITKYKMSAAGKQNAKVTISSSKKSIKVTGVKATKGNNLVLTFKNNKTKKSQTVTCKVVVKEAAPVETKLALTDAKQAASNALNVTFSKEADKDVTKNNLTIKSADNTVELSIKDFDWSTDKKSATVTIFGNFANATEYKVSYDSVDKAFTASVGEVTRVTVDTASAEKDVATDIDFTLWDAQGIDVTPSIDLDSHVIVTVTGTYTTLENTYASKAKITMGNVGDVANVTVTYNSNVSGATDVVGTGEIKCADPTAKTGTMMFKSTNTINKKSECAKFYQDLTDDKVTIALNDKKENVYFCATDKDGDVISYDSYAIESANDNIAGAAVADGATSGKYAKFIVYGNNVGSTQLNITASKNGVDTYYRIPVTVTRTDAATSIVVDQDRRQMSTIDEEDYACIVTAYLLDAEKQKVAADFTAELLTDKKGTKPQIDVSAVSLDENGHEATFKLTFKNAAASTSSWTKYTFKITGVDKNHKDTVFSRNVVVDVKQLPDVLTNVGYQIELKVNGKVANTIEETDKDKNSITSKMYYTSNGLFAGYVVPGAKKTGSNKHLIPTGSVITEVSGCAVRGVDTFSPAVSGTAVAANLVSKVAITKGTGAFGLSDTGMTFLSVKDTNTDQMIDTSNEVAEVGGYNVRYAYSVSDSAIKYANAPFTVARSYKTPTAEVSTSSVYDVSDFDAIIREAITTNVDMNNNDSGYESITMNQDGFYRKEVVGVDLYKKLTVADDVKNNRIVVGYVQVQDTVGNYTEPWYFYAPVNTTFKQR